MTRNYKLCLIIYSAFLVFAIFFMLMLWGASGHQMNFKLEHYLVPVYAILSVSLLIITPKIPNSSKKIKIFFSILAITLLIISLYFAFRSFIEIISGNLNLGFVLFATALIGAFVMSIISLVYQITKNAKSSSHYSGY